MKKNLVLTGMMGVGKSTIGRKLAKELNIKFVDVDKLIEAKEKSTITAIFKKKGEIYFRKIERKTTLDILKKSNLVIALGGGAFLDNVVRKETLRSSISIWLDLSTRSIIKRLKNIKKRPLLDEKNLEVSINKIYSERKKIYNQSNLRVKCDLLEIDQIIKKIIEYYESSRD